MCERGGRAKSFIKHRRQLPEKNYRGIDKIQSKYMVFANARYAQSAAARVVRCKGTFAAGKKEYLKSFVILAPIAQVKAARQKIPVGTRRRCVGSSALRRLVGARIDVSVLGACQFVGGVGSSVCVGWPVHVGSSVQRRLVGASVRNGTCWLVGARRLVGAYCVSNHFEIF